MKERSEGLDSKSRLECSSQRSFRNELAIVLGIVDGRSRTLIVS